MTLHITGDPSADALLTENPFALLTGMMLDQQVTMETAFAGPEKLAQRLGELTPASIAATDPAALLKAFQQSPAVHRFPGSMAERLQSLAKALVDNWNGDAAELWTRGDPTGPEVLGRLRTLPGFGEQKSKIFLALLGKQYGFSGTGWREAAGAYGAEGSELSVADIVDAESLGRVREAKKAAKAAAKAR
ncbi:putative HhH-GPD family protein [Leifsonia sp. AK011]|uniref:HhH-GPD-type base excision DNA repair protein n=1 Tax=Leifsonia sp. AK011 TaxID=2723075 RepID=UPI0015CDB4DF|nr:HhH-GPD-type base excision DNA repair protein [Leifsonia sp. AK011]NYF11144.1 putative HhH-GPD family protein [Leifsonia sp. AK011]